MNQQLVNIIQQLYIDRNVPNFENHIATLQDSYAGMNGLWEVNFKNLQSINHIIIGEAPLWGNLQNYIYNPVPNPTTFFTANNANSVFNTELMKNDKPGLIQSLNERGVLIIDAFPYTLSDDVCLNYRIGNNQFSISQRQYRTLANQTLNHHLLPLMNRILNDKRLVKNPKLTFRYGRVNKFFRGLVTPNVQQRINVMDDHVGLANGILNTERLMANLAV